MVFGTFDIIHPGHIHMLNEAKKYGDYLVVTVARDATVCSVKGKPAIHDEKNRLAAVKKLNIADKVRLGCIDNKYQAIAEEEPDIIALGYDQREFVDNLSTAVKPNTKIVRLAPYMPEIYKSSKLK